MKIDRYHLEHSAECTLLSAEIGGHDLWYRFPPSSAIQRPGDVLLAAALLPAMSLAEPLEVDPSVAVSAKLLQGMESIQRVFACWYPMLHPIEIHARSEESAPGELGEVGSFFSGGVDGDFTFLAHADEITHLVFVKGIDMQLENEPLFQEALAVILRIAQEYGKCLVPVETNVKFFGNSFEPLNWIIYQGAALASIALATDFRKVYVAATHTHSELFPWGTHPLTDVMWSSEATEIIHDGAEASRSEKLRRIAQVPVLLQALRVCWMDAGYNCGRCEKCLRTMATLRLLGAETPTLPRLDSVTPIARMRIDGPSELGYFEDNLRLAQTVGDRALTQALSGAILRYYTRRWLVELDRLLFSGRLRRIRKRDSQG